MHLYCNNKCHMADGRDDLWCPHCGRQIEDGLCPVHAVPDDYADYEEAMRIRDEDGFDG